MFLKFAFLYFLIGLGYIVQKRFPLPLAKVSAGLLYVVMPFFIVGKLGYSDLTPSDLQKPLLVFLVAAVVCVLCYAISAFVWKDGARPNMKFLNAASIPNANTGYFGIPIAVLLFSPDLEAKYILTNFGIGIFQLTIGYYIYAKSQTTILKSAMKLLSFPALWAMVFGLCINFYHWQFPQMVETGLQTVSQIMEYIFTVGGMMIIGMGLASLKFQDINWKTVLWCNAMCYILWPAVAFAAILLDRATTGILQGDEVKILWLMAFCPIGANAVLYANDFKLYPGQATLMVFSSTLVALPVLWLTAMLVL